MVRDIVRWFLFGLASGVGFIAVQAYAQENNFGASYIGFCHERWPCLKSLEVFGGVSVKRLGFLAPPTFGRGCPCYKEFQKLPGEKFVRATITNGTCFKERGRVCGKGEVFEGESIKSADEKLRRRRPDIMRRYKRNATRLKRILAGSLFTTERLALCLECPLSDRARKTMLAIAQEVFPGGVFVDSVLTQRCLPGLVCEKHGLRPRLSGLDCIGDTDGEDFISGDVFTFAERTKDCQAAFLWSFRFNLLDPSLSGFQPPRERTNAPEAWEFDNLRLLLAP